MLCSTFRHPYYPYTGTESGNEHIINVPLAAGASGAEFRAAVTAQWLPALERFKPQLLLISAGFDAHREDDMGGLALREADYAWVTEVLKDLAKRHANGRIVSLEGGYALHAQGAVCSPLSRAERTVSCISMISQGKNDFRRLLIQPEIPLLLY